MFIGGLVKELFNLIILFYVCKFMMKVFFPHSFLNRFGMLRYNKMYRQMGRRHQRYALKTTIKTFKWLVKKIDKQYDKIRDARAKSYEKYYSAQRQQNTQDYDFENVVNFEQYKNRKTV